MGVSIQPTAPANSWFLGMDAGAIFGESSKIPSLMGGNLIGNQSTVKVEVIIILFKLKSSLPFLLFA